MHTLLTLLISYHQKYIFQINILTGDSYTELFLIFISLGSCSSLVHSNLKSFSYVITIGAKYPFKCTQTLLTSLSCAHTYTTCDDVNTLYIMPFCVFAQQTMTSHRDESPHFCLITMTLSIFTDGL